MIPAEFQALARGLSDQVQRINQKADQPPA